MQEDTQLTPAERELEAALHRLHPAGHAIDRDRLMFTAGLRTAQRAQRRWQAATGTLTLLLAASVVLRSAAPATPQVAEIPPSVEPAMDLAEMSLPPLTPSPEDVADIPPELWPPVPRYIHLRNRIVDEGPEMLEDMQLAAVTTAGNEAGPDDLDAYFREQGTDYPRAFGANRDIGG